MRHFVAYHSESRMGYKAEGTDPFSLVTSKSMTDAVGDTVWTITGVGGSPKQYVLCSWFVIDEVQKANTKDFRFILKGKKGEDFVPMLRLDHLEWFRAFRESMANFSLGLTLLKQPIISALQNVVQEAGKPKLTELCVYTIKHSDELRGAIQKGGLTKFTENKKWSKAKSLLDQATRDGERLPIVFAPAEDTSRLFAWGILEEIRPDEITSYSVSNLQLLKQRPKKTTLRKEVNGEPLGQGFIRPYAICRTPSYLSTELLKNGNVQLHPDELSDDDLLIEGASKKVMVNIYERHPENRLRCIAVHGTKCCICKFSFGAAYGEVAEGIIHVHHLRPLSEVSKAHPVNPIEDLRPVCPNCHVVLHRRVPAYSIEEVKRFLQRS
jgi:HNH endonuclease